jgi:hypothetical protein
MTIGRSRRNRFKQLACITTDNRVVRGDALRYRTLLDLNTGNRQTGPGGRPSRF